MRTYLLGIDVGTTGSKALLIDPQGAVRASATTEYPLHMPRPLWAEQNPEDWWRATISSIQRVLRQSHASAKQIAGVGPTGQMHGLVLLDRQGAVIRPCILWNDQRSSAQCAAITKIIGAKQVIRLTGNPVLPGFTAPKLVWVREREPHAYRRVAKVLLPKDYIRYRLTGEFFSEVSDASGTSLFDVGKRRWSDDMLETLDVPHDWLPDVTESPVASAKVGLQAARRTGLLVGTPVVGGGGDQAAQAVGTGVVAEGTVSVTLGTSGVVFAASEKYRVEPQGRLHAFCHAVPGQWHLMGVMLSAGGSLRWYRDALCAAEMAEAKRTGRNVYDVILGPARRVPAGCEGLIFLPYLAGERTPHPDPNARGVFFGLTLRHGKPHLSRAVIEGVSFGLCDSLELIRNTGLPLKQIRASGGGAQSALWRQILADAFDMPIGTVNVTEGAAYGAALLAAVGVGLHRSVADACRKSIRLIGTTKPGKAAGVYADYYIRYRELYPALAKPFETLAAVANKYLEM